MKLNSLDWIAITLVIIGGINWGLVGLFKFNLVDSIFGDLSALSRIIYTLVGVAAVYMIPVVSKLTSRHSEAARHAHGHT